MKTLKSALNEQELKEISDIASSASIFNNFGSFLNSAKDGKEKNLGELWYY